MTRNKFQNITNQEILTELETRLPNFTQDEFMTFAMIIGKYQEEIFKIVQTANPRVYSN